MIVNALTIITKRSMLDVAAALDPPLVSYISEPVHFNPLGANPTKWSNTLKQFVGNLLGCVWPFCEIGA